MLSQCHPTFQEYFAAQAIDDWHYFLNHTPDNPAQGIYRIFEPFWKEVILLWLGREDVPYEQKEEFIKALVEFEDACEDFYGDRAYLLAATGIAEFGACSRASVIVAQIVQWGFGYFNLEKQQWWTFLEPLDREARATLLKTERGRAIAALVQLIESTQDKEIRWQVAESLGKIDPGNPEAISVLVQLIESTENKSICRQAASSLGNIDRDNPIAMAALLQLIDSTEDKYIRRQAAYSLGEIGKGNSEAVAALLQLIESTQNEFTRRLAAYSLGGEIGKGNPEAVAALVQLIESTKNESTRRQAAYSLGNIDPGNPTAIAALVQLIGSSKNESIRGQAAYSLGEISKGNKDAIAALVQLIESTENESTRWQAAYSLGKIDPGNPEAVAVLVQLIESTQDKSILWQAAYSLVEIGKGNEQALAVLARLIESAENESIRRRAAYSLGKIDSGNKVAIATLVRLIELTENESNRRQAAYSLGKIDFGNETAIAALVQLITSTTEDEFIRWQAVESLKKTVRDDQLAGVVTRLKDYLSAQSYENDFQRCRDCYEVIWYCAQNMSYPTFYQAWHTQPTPKRPEVLETTTVSSHLITHSLNLAELPQRLSVAIANDPALSQTIHLICLDGSKFINPNNPAAKIYAQMVKSGCPKCEDGTPKTMLELQTYWDLLESDKHVVLVFYQDPVSTALQKFSDILLDALSKFEGAICVVTEPPLGKSSLQCFSFCQPQLLEEILSWIRVKTLEAQA